MFRFCILLHPNSPCYRDWLFHMLRHRRWLFDSCNKCSYQILVRQVRYLRPGFLQAWRYLEKFLEKSRWLPMNLWSHASKFTLLPTVPQCSPRFQKRSIRKIDTILYYTIFVLYSHRLHTYIHSIYILILFL